MPPTLFTQDLLSIVASVLHLGNIHFAADEESNAQVTTENQLKYLTRVSERAEERGRAGQRGPGGVYAHCAHPLPAAARRGRPHIAGSPDAQKDYCQGRGGETGPLFQGCRVVGAPRSLQDSCLRERGLWSLRHLPSDGATMASPGVPHP